MFCHIETPTQLNILFHLSLYPTSPSQYKISQTSDLPSWFVSHKMYGQAIVKSDPILK